MSISKIAMRFTALLEKAKELAGLLLHCNKKNMIADGRRCLFVLRSTGAVNAKDVLAICS